MRRVGWLHILWVSFVAAVGCSGDAKSAIDDAGSGGMFAATTGATLATGGQMGALTGGDSDASTGATGGSGTQGSGGGLTSTGGSALNTGGTASGAELGCTGHDYKLCEDFEAASEGGLPPDWSPHAGWSSGEAVVTSAQFHSGGKSLAAAIGETGQPRAERSLSALGATAGTHWGRIFYKINSPAPLPSNGAVIHNTLVGLQGSTESRVVDTVVNSAGQHQFLYNLPDDSCCSGSDYDYASYDNAWHCAEWYVDATTQSYRFFFEGVEVPSIGFENRPDDSAHIEQYSAVIVGWINYQNAPTPYYEAWFDDLAIDDARIGCD